ncbi:TPA: tetratricopeptide repeat protein [Methanosarcinaceae archaeon]|nr:tetratricopeptide repeat protein [Methanosarcinaceae archaeon]
MSPIKKVNSIVNLFVLLVFTLFIVSSAGPLPVEGAVSTQGLVAEDARGAGDFPSLEEVLAQNPTSVEGLIAKGNALYSLGEYEISVDFYKKALSLDPDSSAAWYAMGLSLEESGLYEDSLDCYDKALETSPDSS